MKNLKTITISLVILLTTTSVNLIGQDAHFSQLYSSPMLLNPAKTGDYLGDWRFANAYRTQWYSVTKPFSTLSLSYDRQTYLKYDAFATGATIIQEKSGNLALTGFHIYLSEAYQKVIKNHLVQIGIQAGYIRRYYSTKQMTFPNQFDMSVGYFSPELENHENNLDVSSNYWDVNTGILWNMEFSNIIFQIGAAAFHLNHPKETFSYDTDYAKDRTYNMAGRQVFHTKLKWSMMNTIYLTPKLVAMRQAKAQEVLFGLDVSYAVLQDEQVKNEFFIGGYVRRNNGANQDAIVLLCGAKSKKITATVSYDITTSYLKTIPGNTGAIEISLLYTGISTRQILQRRSMVRF